MTRSKEFLLWGWGAAGWSVANFAVGNPIMGWIMVSVAIVDLVLALIVWLDESN